MEQEIVKETIFIKPDDNLSALHQITKEIFNHIRNYLICLSLYIAGKAANLDAEWEFFGTIIVGVSILLAFLYTTCLTISVVVAFNPKDASEEEAGDEDCEPFLYIKMVFDHLRNYLICSSLYVVGKLAVTDSNLLVSNIGKFVAVLSVPLAILNSIYVVSFVWTNFSPKRLTGRGSKGQSPRLVLLSLYLALVYVIVGFTAAVKLGS